MSRPKLVKRRELTLVLIAAKAGSEPTVTDAALGLNDRFSKRADE